jgi:transcription termination factor 2
VFTIYLKFSHLIISAYFRFDIYAAIKFLRCTPFDDLRYWRTWIETKRGSSPRLQALLKSILLRRTKQQLQESGEIKSLPEKHIEQIKVSLNGEERAVYNRIMVLSKQIFAQFLTQQQAKHNNFTYDNNNLGKLHQKFARIMKVDREIKSHEILTLLLRLRQICCHPGLVKSVLEDGDINKEELDNDLNASANDSDVDILNKLQNLKIGDQNGNQGAGQSGEDITITQDSEVFNFDIPSSKIEVLMNIIREKLLTTDDKAIIVSQWVTYLNIIKAMLEVENIAYCELNGSVPVKYRNDIVVEFNRPKSRQKVMLLSITAGGVGLNLVGANQLYFMDPHWNPQIEQQAQDRIYRFGQTKNVKIVK